MCYSFTLQHLRFLILCLSTQSLPEVIFKWKMSKEYIKNVTLPSTLVTYQCASKEYEGCEVNLLHIDHTRLVSFSNWFSFALQLLAHVLCPSFLILAGPLSFPHVSIPLR